MQKKYSSLALATVLRHCVLYVPCSTTRYRNLTSTRLLRNLENIQLYISKLSVGSFILPQRFPHQRIYINTLSLKFHKIPSRQRHAQTLHTLFLHYFNALYQHSIVREFCFLIWLTGVLSFSNRSYFVVEYGFLCLKFKKILGLFRDIDEIQFKRISSQLN